MSFRIFEVDLGYLHVWDLQANCLEEVICILVPSLYDLFHCLHRLVLEDFVHNGGEKHQSCYRYQYHVHHLRRVGRV